MFARIRTITNSALEHGSLVPLETKLTRIPGNDLTPPFEIRLLSKHKKPRNKNMSYRQNSPETNPFLPYDQSLYVQHVSPSHVILLNKFPIVENHVLIVTSIFQPQSSLLTYEDHTAMWQVLSDFASLAFYNAGPVAGASQSHKHLQVIPDNNNNDIPFDSFIHEQVKEYNNNTVARINDFPFLHGVINVNDVAEAGNNGDFQMAGQLSMQKYIQLIGYLQSKIIQSTESASTVRPFSYNLLCTRRWMLVVPRRKECFEGVSVNALGFAGFILVRDDESLSSLKESGIMKILSEVAFINE